MVGEGFVRECHFCWDMRTKSQPFMGQPSEECSGSRHSMCKGPVSTSCCLVAFLTFTVEASLFSTIFNKFSFYLHISHFNLMPAQWGVSLHSYHTMILNFVSRLFSSDLCIHSFILTLSKHLTKQQGHLPRSCHIFLLKVTSLSIHSHIYSLEFFSTKRFPSYHCPLGLCTFWAAMQQLGTFC